MRDIEFRGKHIESGLWVYGYVAEISTYEVTGHRIAVGIYEKPEREFGGGWWKVDPETVGQYTGLKDKNGTKIFEGDIVLLKGDEEPYQVVFDESCFQVYDSSVCYVMDNFYDYEIEVIGNIYDNPELLEGDNNEVS